MNWVGHNITSVVSLPPNGRHWRNINWVTFYKITGLNSSKTSRSRSKEKLRDCSKWKECKESRQGIPMWLSPIWGRGREGLRVNSIKGHYLNKLYHLKVDSGLNNTIASMLHFLTLIVILWLCKKIVLVIYLKKSCKSWISIWTQSVEVSLLADHVKRKDVRTGNSELVVTSPWPFPELPDLGHKAFVP